VGHDGDLTPGSFVPTELGGLPVVVTRDAAATIHALVNVCGHRGAIVCETSGERDSLACPYHAWRYELDGTLRNAPRSERENGFDPEKHGLERLPIAQWGPFIFVAGDPAAPPFEEVLADLPDRLADLGLDLGSLQFHSRAVGDLAANWKVCVENFLECYHCRVSHPAFAKVIDTGPDDYLLETAPTYSSQYGPVRAAAPTAEFDPRGPLERGQFHLLFPNTAINIMPGHANLSIGPITPTGPRATHRFLDYFFGETVSPDWIEDMLAFDARVGAEDVVLVESVQRGMEAAPDREGILFVDSERLIAHFNDYVRNAID
jgi:choline monooxygenase